VSPAALLIAVLADEAHGAGWLEAKTARVALTDRRKFVHFQMGQQLDSLRFHIARHRRQVEKTMSTPGLPSS
jgi:hypothetical protein